MSSESSGLSPVAKAGIGIAVTAILLGAILVGLLVWRRRDREGTTMISPRCLETGQRGIGGAPELDDKETRTHAIELARPPVPPKPDKLERSRISITFSGTPPKHVGFQARC